MPVQWIRRPQKRRIENVMRAFVYASNQAAGFLFEVDAGGAVQITSRAGRENYAFCLVGLATGIIVDAGLTDFSRDYWDAGAVKCQCGKVVELRPTQRRQCGCGLEYASDGAATSEVNELINALNEDLPF